MKPAPLDQSNTNDDINGNQQIVEWLINQQREASQNGDVTCVEVIYKLLGKCRQDASSIEPCANDNNNPVGKSPWKNYKMMLIIWVAMIGFATLAWRLGVDKRIIAPSVVLVGVVSQAFAWLVGIVAVVPIIGPLIIKILSIPAIWLLNSIGYFISIVAIKRGYSKDVLTYRGITVALIIGIVIGYIIGEFIG